MSNDLSKQLCELCGIEAKCVNCGRTVSDENPCPKPCDKQKFPDLTKPENFVRLFNLTLPIRGISSIAEFVTFEYLTITDSKDFLKKLIKSIQEPYTDNEVIKSIREAEWVYE